MKYQAILHCILPVIALFSTYTQTQAAETTDELDVLYLFMWGKTPGDGVQHFEFSSGGNADPQCWSTYSAVTWALGEPVDTDGFRLRLTGGVSRYSFNSLMEDTKGGVLPITNVAQAGFGDALAGYRANYGGLWITALGGAAYDTRIITPSGEIQESFSPKAVMEAWLNVTERSWINANIGYSRNRREYSGSLRFGLRALDFLDLGPEAGAAGDIDSSRGQAGEFLKLNYQDVEMTVSGGMAGDYEHASTYYGNLNLFRKF